jgi:hypothetical protein
MNIILKESHLNVATIAEDGSYFTLSESIGFSTGDTIEGFNKYNTDYVDGNGTAYPKINEAVLLAIPFKNSFSTSGLVDSTTDYAITRDIDDVDTLSYDDVSYSPSISLSPGDGWYTIHFILLPTTSTTEPYYNAESGQFIDPVLNNGDGKVVTSKELLEYTTLSSITLQTFQTPLQSKKLNCLIGEVADAGLLKGAHSKEYKNLLHSAFYVDAMLCGAHVKYNDGYANLAQQIIEDLENSDPYGE